MAAALVLAEAVEATAVTTGGGDVGEREICMSVSGLCSD